MSRPESALERAAPLSGVAFVVLSIAGIAMAALGLDYLDDPDRIIAHFEDRTAMVTAGASLGVVSGAALVWFGGSLWKALRRAEGPGGRISVIAFGGAVASGTAVILAHVVLGTAGERAGAGNLSLEGATTLYDLAMALWGAAAPVALAVAVLATAVVSFRHRAFPAWWGWVSALLALAMLLLPISWLGFIVAHLWILILSIWLLTRGSPAPGDA